jgi:hypothetical protein
VHPVDGIPEIPTDGSSFTTITVQKVDERWQPQTDRNDTDLLYLRADYGTLRSADGAEEIRTIKLEKGQATLRLVSEKARRVATVCKSLTPIRICGTAASALNSSEE